MLGTHSSTAPVGKGADLGHVHSKQVKVQKKPDPSVSEHSNTGQQSPHIFIFIESERWYDHHQQKKKKQSSVQKSHLHCLFKAKFLNLQQAIIDGMGKFLKGHFCLFYLVYNVSYFIVIEKLIWLSK